MEKMKNAPENSKYGEYYEHDDTAASRKKSKSEECYHDAAASRKKKSRIKWDLKDYPTVESEKDVCMETKDANGNSRIQRMHENNMDFMKAVNEYVKDILKRGIAKYEELRVNEINKSQNQENTATGSSPTPRDLTSIPRDVKTSKDTYSSTKSLNGSSKVISKKRCKSSDSRFCVLL